MKVARMALCAAIAAVVSAEAPHEVDRLVSAYFAKAGVTPPPTVDDALFARRAYLDVWGLLPPPDELRAFLDDQRTEKRTALVDRLLADNQRYSEHWISFWNDLLRNDEGVIYHGGRKSITPWLLQSLQTNKPYHLFVSELLNPVKEGGSDGFLTGVNWRGDVSASQTSVMQAAMNSAQVFLGVNLKCAACHDSFVSRWKLRQTYGLASFFSPEPLKLSRCDVELDETAKPEFLFPELGGVPPDATFEERRAVAARLFTAEPNGRFPRTLVNRVWRQLFGRGLIEPVDEMDSKPWSTELLDWLATDFVEHGYDSKHLLRRVMTSRTYQLEAVRDAGESPPAAFTFRGPQLRRLSAEQFLDGIAQATGEWGVLRPAAAGAGAYGREWRFKSNALTRALGRPIRDQVYTERSTKPTTLQALELVNGRYLSQRLWRAARRMLGELPPAAAPAWDSGNMNNGARRVMAPVDIRGARKLWLVLEDAGSYDPPRVVAGWFDMTLTRADGTTVPLSSLRADRTSPVRPIQTRELLQQDAIAPGLPATLIFDLKSKGFVSLQGGAAVEMQQSALGILPTVRFFVFTREPVRDGLTAAEGEPPLAAVPPVRDTSRLIARIWQQAYSREPYPAELAAAKQFLRGRRVSADGLEDLLWSVFLSPEYQFIR